MRAAIGAVRGGRITVAAMAALTSYLMGVD